LKKRKSKKIESGLKKILVVSDYQRIKTISLRSCLECGECVLESGGCCSGCVKSVNSMACQQTEKHCLEHKHDHHHHEGDIKGYLVIGLFPFVVGAVLYRIIKILKK
jgi:hypothetical protein